MRIRTVPILLCLLVSMAATSERALACSVVMCAGDGMEVTKRFAVLVRLDRRPLANVEVKVHPSNSTVPSFTGQTDAKGRILVEGLQPGKYWIDVTYLNINAGYHCFHIARTPSYKAKNRLRYEWGYAGIPMRIVAGVVREWRPGTGGHRLANLAHSTHGPIGGAKLSLRAARFGGLWLATSDDSGRFAFPQVPDGTYVLHIDGRSDGDPYEARDLVITVSSSATRDVLTLTRRETGCGNVTLNPDWQ